MSAGIFEEIPRGNPGKDFQGFLEGIPDRNSEGINRKLVNSWM